jgi:hypothetical protein
MDYLAILTQCCDQAILKVESDFRVISFVAELGVFLLECHPVLT